MMCLSASAAGQILLARDIHGGQDFSALSPTHSSRSGGGGFPAALAVASPHPATITLTRAAREAYGIEVGRPGNTE